MEGRINEGMKGLRERRTEKGTDRRDYGMNEERKDGWMEGRTDERVEGRKEGTEGRGRMGGEIHKGEWRGERMNERNDG